jgi:hypothetical protein
MREGEGEGGTRRSVSRISKRTNRRRVPRRKEGYRPAANAIGTNNDLSVDASTSKDAWLQFPMPDTEQA